MKMLLNLMFVYTHPVAFERKIMLFCFHNYKLCFMLSRMGSVLCCVFPSVCETVAMAVENTRKTFPEAHGD